MSHALVALLGDSIFDNAAYTRGEPDVVTHLRTLLGDPSAAVLCAVDGAVIRDVARQVPRVPVDATHVVLSVGGNDALRNYDLLNTPVRSTAEALSLFAARAEPFEASYRRALDTVLALGKPVAICTIYNGDVGPQEGPLARTALAIFNDVIARAGFERDLQIIELRHICSSPSDYANPIEPSGTGGMKIAEAIARWVNSSRSLPTSQ